MKWTRHREGWGPAGQSGRRGGGLRRPTVPAPPLCRTKGGHLLSSAPTERILVSFVKHSLGVPPCFISIFTASLLTALWSVIPCRYCIGESDFVYIPTPVASFFLQRSTSLPPRSNRFLFLNHDAHPLPLPLPPDLDTHSLNHLDRGPCAPQDAFNTPHHPLLHSLSGVPAGSHHVLAHVLHRPLHAAGGIPNTPATIHPRRAHACTHPRTLAIQEADSPRARGCEHTKLNACRLSLTPHEMHPAFPSARAPTAVWFGRERDVRPLPRSRRDLRTSLHERGRGVLYL